MNALQEKKNKNKGMGAFGDSDDELEANLDDDGLPDRGSKRRGILTDDFMIEPFFEYYEKINETHTPRLERP